jgi:hypothetical protein
MHYACVRSEMRTEFGSENLIETDFNAKKIWYRVVEYG